ncbi:hypothetical protein AJ78_06818 [Emergomyces pasteurianus Ep9510]|uniref:PH domain-containing protein n=1 Tax=Emergomyces pasteurianus Ep9510 TaxID=1447872 RepID=A0A1J9QBT1_9EURO|nr:hypothetical protein AJ78_06818 [Emergomyces pasteurianus Ep9510]
MDSRPRTASSSTSSPTLIKPPQLQAPPKFSRYRSVRKAAEAQAIQNAAAQSFPTPSSPPPLPVNSKTSPPPSFAKTQNESIKRSMSRYRNAKPGATKASDSVPPPPPLPAAVALPSHPPTQGDCIQGDQEREQHEVTLEEQDAGSPQRRDRVEKPSASYASCFQEAAQPASQINKNGGSSEVGPVDHDTENAKSPTEYSPSERNSSIAGMEELRPRGSRTNADREHENAPSPTSESHNTPTTPSRLRTVVKPRKLDIPDSVQNITNEELAANERATAAHNGSKPRSHSIKGKSSGFLSRMKALDPTSSSKLNNNSSKSNKSSSNNRGKLKPLISSPQPIRPEDVKVASGNEAPVSAVNAGERKVLVTCNDSFISLPISLSTQTQDLLYSAANCLSENIDPQSSILVEYFKQLGLERPLRRYEHIRDVMNSWESDSQNHLRVSRLPDKREREGLDVKSAPRKQPSESAFQLYHSQRPGKWEKRWITLRSDGQVVMAKKQGGESVNICHLSDFDIYSPTSRETVKRIKAPRKICFAVKSQQKSTMFLTTENFVHYFATDDEPAALEWYKAVQRWRSWYLVNVLGEGEANEKQSINSNPKSPRATGVQKTTSNGRKNSDASIPYQLGTFKPLLDLDISSWKIEPVENIVEKQQPTPPKKAPILPKAASVYARSIRPQKRPSTSVKKPKKELANESDPDPFTSTGLLGRTYTQRKKALEDRERDPSQCGFTGLGLLNNVGPECTTSPSDRSSRRSSRDHAIPPIPTSPNGSASAAFSRSKSIKHKPKPLVDLTPVYQEPPQHARKGRGVTAESGLPLVEAATGPELPPGAIIIPSASTWRKPTLPTTAAQPVQPPAADIAQQQLSSRPPNITRGSGSIHHRPTTSHTTSIRHCQRAATVKNRSISSNNNNNNNDHYYNHDLGAPVPAPDTTKAHESLFAPTGLLARSATTSTTHPGWHDTGRGVATGDRNNFTRPMLDLSQDSQFAEGSLLREVEAGKVGKGARVPVPAPVIDRG